MPKVTDIVKKIFDILVYVAEKGETNQLAISKDLEIRYQTVGDYLDYLENLGLLNVEMARTVPPMKKVTLTEKGKCIAKCLSTAS